ncbi:MAG TPA: cytochrome c-type biogenesis CcmF C-terminal domain-containing protein [Acidimicrobiales bacterium]|nr:cytochrome c-type biogenesis CcmF C-terminal domain-containing protein [Acidimicrobiales bacterium]
MRSLLGHGAVLLGFVAALAGIASTAGGLARRRPSAVAAGRRYVWLVLAAGVLATAAMEWAMIGRDFSLAYVAANDSRSTPLLFRVTGMWSALQGSILLWALILAAYLAAMGRRFRRRGGDPVVGWAMVAGLAVAAFFFGLMLGPADPFRHVAGAVPTDGPGPNPLLQNNPLVAFHPPLLYLGYVGFTVPFAFAIGALVTGRVGESWLVETRRWTLLAWGCLSAGIVLGMWWSYQVLGWGGFWAWDPVENASLLPWLCATAYLHSAAVQQRRGMLRVWNLSLLMATFSLTILGTFLTRSGVVESVHSFSESTLGPLILSFFGLVVAAGVGLIAWRGDLLRSPGAVDSPGSREGAFLLNNLLFAAFAFVVLLGTVFPLLAQAINGQTLAVGRPYFDRMVLPIALCLLFLMAVAPALPWRKAAAPVVRARLLVPAWAGAATIAGCVLAGVRGVLALVAFGLAAFAGSSALRQLATRVRRSGPAGLLGRSGGGMVVHVGVVVLAAGFAASSAFGHRGELRLTPGQSAAFAGHSLTYLGTRDARYSNRTAVEGLVTVDGRGLPARPAVSQFAGVTEGIGTPAVVSGPREDVYLTLDAVPSTPGGPAVIGVVVQPLIMWMWVGGGVIALGTVLAAAPDRSQRRRRLAKSPADEIEVTTDLVSGDVEVSRGAERSPVGVPGP